MFSHSSFCRTVTWGEYMDNLLLSIGRDGHPELRSQDLLNLLGYLLSGQSIAVQEEIVRS